MVGKCVWSAVAARDVCWGQAAAVLNPSQINLFTQGFPWCPPPYRRTLFSCSGATFVLFQHVKLVGTDKVSRQNQHHQSSSPCGVLEHPEGLRDSSEKSQKEPSDHYIHHIPSVFCHIWHHQTLQEKTSQINVSLRCSWAPKRVPRQLRKVSKRALWSPHPFGVLSYLTSSNFTRKNITNQRLPTVLLSTQKGSKTARKSHPKNHLITRSLGVPWLFIASFFLQPQHHKSMSPLLCSWTWSSPFRATGHWSESAPRGPVDRRSCSSFIPWYACWARWPDWGRMPLWDIYMYIYIYIYIYTYIYIYI